MNFKDISINDASFSLVRTNPKLTGNIKLTIDSDNKIWLNSIDANVELSKDMYKKYAINSKFSHPGNIMKFFNRGKVSTDILYDVFTYVDPTKISNNFNDQYDFSLYFSGAKYLKSTQYSERFSYFSPLYIKNQDIPEYFVIFKIDDPINDNIKILKDNPSKYESSEYMYDLLNKSTLIKTFDLRKGTIIGDYLRNIFCDDLYPNSPLSVNFNKNEMTYWKGIDVKNGVYSQKGEYLYDFYKSDYPIKYFENYITSGYERHGILFPDIINLEFLFDDETSKLFDHNRYIGFYINEMQLSKFIIDAEKQKNDQLILGNIPHIYNTIDQLLNVDLFLNNDNGVSLKSLSDEKIVLSDGISIPSYIDLIPSLNNQLVPYIKDKNENIYSISNLTIHEDESLDVVTVTKKEINLKDFIGSDKIVSLSDSGLVVESPGKSFISLKLNGEIKNTDELLIYYDGGSRIDQNGRFYDSIIFSTGFGSPAQYGDVGEHYAYIQNYSNSGIEYKDPSSFMGYWNTIDQDMINNLDNGEYVIVSQNGDSSSTPFELLVDGTLIWFYNISILNSYKINDIIKKENDVLVYNSDVSDLFNYYYVGINGANGYELLSNSISDCLNEFPSKGFNVYTNNGEILIISNSNGNNNDKISVKFISKTNLYSSIIINGLTGNDIKDKIIQSIGGTEYSNILLIDNIHEGSINVNSLVKIKSGYSKIKEVTKYAGLFYRNMNNSDLLNAFDIVDNKIAIVLDKNEIPLIQSGKFEITNEYNITLGALSFYGIKDFDFDFYSNRYGKYPYWENYKHFYIPADKELLQFNTMYLVLGSGRLSYNGIEYSGGTYFHTNIKIGNEKNNKYSIISGDPIVIPWFYLNSDTINLSEIVNGSDYQITNEGISIGMNYIVNDDSSTIVYYPIHDQNPDIILFEGFSTLRDNDISFDSTLKSFSYKDKFIKGLLRSEYDLYKENYYPGFSNSSKMVPYVCKWGYVNGDDSRNNPYRLDTSLVFGVNNFSPSHIIDSQSPKNMTHEWYYLVSDYKIDDNDINYDNYCYIKDGLDIESPEFNFIDKFTYESNGSIQYRYSNIKFNKDTGLCETFFRGVRLSFNELSKGRYDTDTNGKPLYVKNSRKYDGYKFTSVLQPIKESDNSKPPIEMIVKEDHDQKYIIYLIKFYVGDLSNININSGHENPFQLNDLYESIGTYKGLWDGSSEFDSLNIGDYYIMNYTGILENPIYIKLIDDSIVEYTSCKNGDIIRYNGGSPELWSLNPNPYKYMDVLYSTNPLYKIDGDYKIKFDSLEISDLTYTQLYSLLHKKISIIDNFYSTIKIPSNLNIIQLGNRTNINVINNQYPDYVNNLMDEISNFEKNNILVYTNTIDSNINGIHVSMLDVVNFDPSKFIPMDFNPIVKSLNEIGVFYKYDYYNIHSFDIDYNKKSYPVYTKDLKQISGGKNYYKKLINKLSFSNIKSYFNTYSSFIQYSDNSLGYIEILDDSVITKTKKLNISEIKTNKVIGYNYDIKDLDYPYNIYRYQGRYMPIFRDIIFYSSNFIEDLKFPNIKFNSSIKNFGELENFCHLKISDKNIFEFSNNSKYNLEYELIDVVNIGQSNLSILHTSWDYGFHNLYSTKNTFEKVAGSLRIEEDDTFINNIITLPNEVNLTKFSSELVNDISIIDMKNKQIVYQIKNNIVTGKINIIDIFSSKLVDLGINKCFELLYVDAINQSEFIGNITMNEYIKLYIDTNIAPLYDVNYVYTYLNKIKGSNKFNISNSDLNNIDISNLILDKDVKINKSEKYIITFTYELKSNYNSEINFDVTLKLI